MRDDADQRPWQSRQHVLPLSRATRYPWRVEAVDGFARGCTVALLTMMGLVLLRLPGRAVTWTDMQLSRRSASYLVLSSPDFGGSPIITPLLQGAALATPVTFWFFHRTFSGDEQSWRPRCRAAGAVVAVGFWRPAAVAQVLSTWPHQGLVGVALTQVLRGFSGDLVEPPKVRALSSADGRWRRDPDGTWRRAVARKHPTSRELETFKSVAALSVALAFGLWLLTPAPDLVSVIPTGVTRPRRVERARRRRRAV